MSRFEKNEKGKKGQFVLIKWIEHPPRWDIVPEKNVESGELKIGALCTVRYGKRKEVGQAELLEFGKHMASLSSFMCVGPS